MNVWIGIDPGASGGYAWISDGDKRFTAEWDDAKFIEEMRSVCKFGSDGLTIKTCLERVGAMPGNGSVSMFKFGKSAGFIEGVLQAFHIPYELISPQKWKKEFSLTSDKSKSIEVCNHLFPDVNLLRTERCKKPHDGMAEALLMAEYARRKM